MALAEFLSKINYQETCNRSNLLVKFISNDLQKGLSPDINVDEQFRYDLNLPINFNQFLVECVTILTDNNVDEPDFSSINNEFVIILIYSGLCSTDSVLLSDSVPMQAATLFFTLCSGKYGDSFEIDNATFGSVLERLLEAIEDRVLAGMKITTSFISVWKQFLATNNKRFDMRRMSEVLALCMAKNTLEIIESFSSDDDTSSDIPKSLFACLMTLMEKKSFEDIRNTVAFVGLNLARNCTSEIVNKNVQRFFQDVLHKFCNEKWYLSMLILVLEEIKNKEIFIQILNKLPPDRHEVILNMIINTYVQATTESEVKMYLIVLNLMIKFPYQDMPDERRQKLVRRILTETYYRTSAKNIAIRELVMDLFVSWSQMKDLYVRRHLQQMFRINNKVQNARLFEMLLQGVDISWKYPPYNITFIIFTCRMFMLNRSFITHYRMRVLETLCYKATAHCLKPCVPTIVELVRHFALSPHPVLKPLLTMFVSNSLSATTAANYYMKEFYGLLANCMVAENDGEIDYAICEIILSDDFNCLELFKTLQIHNFIRAEHIKVLLEEKILKYPGSWKLLSVLLNSCEYTEFPLFMEHYLTKMSSNAFYTRPESVYVLQVLQKMFTFKTKTKSMSPADTKLALMIEQYLTKSIKDLGIPTKHVNDSLILLQTLNKATKGDLNWIKSFSKEKLLYVLGQDTQLPIRPVISRHVMYLEQILILFDIEIDNDQVEHLLEMVDAESKRVLPFSDQIYARLVSFFGKLCLKRPEYVNQTAPLLQQAMVKGSPTVQLLAMASLYDVSTFVMNHYDTLYPGLLTLIKGENPEVKNMAVKVLIKLVNDNRVRLSCSEFITLMLLLVDRNYKLCLFFMDIFESDFIHRNQHTISKYFINLLFYLNNFQNHELYPTLQEDVSLGKQDFSYERRIVIYKFLFCNLERQNQLQILNALNEDFLVQYYREKLKSSTVVLNVLRDIFALISFNASQYLTECEIDGIDEFFKGLFADINRDFFTRKRLAEASVMEFDKTLEKLLVSLLRILYKIEKSHLSMLPQVMSTVGLATRAFYNKIVHMVQENTALKDLYYELESCYTKYSEMVKSEPLDLLDFCEREEWRLYVGLKILIS